MDGTTSSPTRARSAISFVRKASTKRYAHPVRRERIVAVIIVLTCNGPTWADDEDAVIRLASDDMKCEELTMTREANHFYFAGCGQRRVYECSRDQCVYLAPRFVDKTCEARNVGHVAGVGCAACLAGFSGGTSLPTVLHEAPLEDCTREGPFADASITFLAAPSSSAR